MAFKSFEQVPISSKSCIQWHTEREQRRSCSSMPRTEAKAKYAALRQVVPSDLRHDHFDWTEKKRLGSGSFGSVSSVPLATTGERVAVKMDKKSELDGKWAKREIQILDQITSNDAIPHVTHLLGGFSHQMPTGDEAQYIVQPLYKKSLQDIVFPEGEGEYKPTKPLDPGRMLKLTVQLERAITALHAEGIIHRDLKTENVMVDENGDAKIIDFGVAYSKSIDDPCDPCEGIPKQRQQAGTPTYWAPEIWRNEGYDGKVDVWAMGVILYTMGVGYHPFIELRGSFFPRRAMMSSTWIPPEARERYGDEWVAFVYKLLSELAIDRPAAKELRNEPYLQGISDQTWSALAEPFANTEYLLGIDLPEEPLVPPPPAHVPESGPLAPKPKQGSLFVHYKRSVDHNTWLATTKIRLSTTVPIAESEMATPKPRHAAHFGQSNRASLCVRSSEYDTATFDSPALESNSTVESSPEPSPLFTPADSECEVDPFELDADVLNIALNKKVEEAEARELYNDRIARAGLAPQV